MLDYKMTSLALELAGSWLKSAEECETIEEKLYCQAQAEYYWKTFTNSEFPKGQDGSPIFVY